MTRKSILIAAAIALSLGGLGFFFSDTGSERPAISAQDAVKNYLTDPHPQTRLEQTSQAEKVAPPSKDSGSEKRADDIPQEEQIANEHSAGMPEHNLAEYFRYLQTQISEGNSPAERTESIRHHLLETLPRDKAEELIELYEKFTNFERDAVTRAEEWNMPESAEETLELIGKMQAYQEEYFGQEAAKSIFGAEMKTMEYDARKAIILNDRNVSGQEKEQLLEQLGRDMWGAEIYREMNANKDPYDILDEKLIIYRDDLAALDPDTRADEIAKLRAKYLPPGY